jgi:hypothetical protein
LDGRSEADTLTDIARAARREGGLNVVKNYMHSQQFGADFRQFIPRFRRFGGSPMTLRPALPTLSSLAAHYRCGDMKNGRIGVHPIILLMRHSMSTLYFVS